jgi:preprotein translocase subunit SecG
MFLTDSKMLTTILMILQITVCVAMVFFVLMQQSEGGALGMGGSPSGFMSARGAGDLLTRITWSLFAVFLLISISLTWLSAREQASSSVIDRVKSLSLDNQLPAAPKPLPTAPVNPLGGTDLAPPTPSAPAAAGLPSALGGKPIDPTIPQAPAAPAPDSKPKQ